MFVGVFKCFFILSHLLIWEGHWRLIKKNPAARLPSGPLKFSNCNTQKSSGQDKQATFLSAARAAAYPAQLPTGKMAGGSRFFPGSQKKSAVFSTAGADFKG